MIERYAHEEARSSKISSNLSELFALLFV